MNPNIERLKLIFVAAFVVLVLGALVWQVGWILPQKNCESARKWWDGDQPVLISDITGRTIGDKSDEAAAKAAIGRTPAPKAP